MFKKLLISLFIFTNCFALEDEQMNGFDGLINNIEQSKPERQQEPKADNEIRIDINFQIPQNVINLPDRSLEIFKLIPTRLKELKNWARKFLVTRETDQFVKRLIILTLSSIAIITAGIGLYSNKSVVRDLAKRTILIASISFIFSNLIAKKITEPKWQIGLVITILAFYNNETLKPYIFKMYNKLEPKFKTLINKYFPDLI